MSTPDPVNIRVQLNRKLIRTRHMDWEAWVEGDDDCRVGFGLTKWDALRELAELMEDDDE